MCPQANRIGNLERLIAAERVMGEGATPTDWHNLSKTLGEFAPQDLYSRGKSRASSKKGEDYPPNHPTRLDDYFNERRIEHSIHLVMHNKGYVPGNKQAFSQEFREYAKAAQASMNAWQEHKGPWNGYFQMAFKAYRGPNNLHHPIRAAFLLEKTLNNILESGRTGDRLPQLEELKTLRARLGGNWRQFILFVCMSHDIGKHTWPDWMSVNKKFSEKFKNAEQVAREMKSKIISKHEIRSRDIVNAMARNNEAGVFPDELFRVAADVIGSHHSAPTGNHILLKQALKAVDMLDTATTRYAAADNKSIPTIMREIAVRDNVQSAIPRFVIHELCRAIGRNDADRIAKELMAPNGNRHAA